MPQQHGAERSHGLPVGMPLRVVNTFEPRLHDVVAVPEVNEVARESCNPRACRAVCRPFRRRARVLDVVQLLGLLGVDGRDEMDPLGLVERSRPVFRRARPDIPEFPGAGGHAFDEFVREHFERRSRRAERAQSLIGQANVETGVRPALPPSPRS